MNFLLKQENPSVWLVIMEPVKLLFRIILDLIRPTSGTVTINHIEVQKSEEWKRITGSYLDENFLIDYLTPEEYFDFVGKLFGYTNEDVQLHLSRFETLFNGEILGKKKFIRDLYKGNLKKVGIASALMGNPEVVVLDEPFENLDPSSQIRLKNILNEERQERKVTFLISSHDLSHVTEVCERIVILEKGKVVKDLSNEEDVMGTLHAYFTA
jgi:ABC-2 type transport system ATP-binding protein